MGLAEAVRSQDGSLDLEEGASPIWEWGGGGGEDSGWKSRHCKAGDVDVHCSWEGEPGESTGNGVWGDVC